MYLIEMTTSLPLQGLTQGERVYAHDVNAGELLANDWCRILSAVPSDDHLREPVSTLKSTHRVLIIRPGGLGDLLLMTPALRELARHCQVGVACWKHCAPALAGVPEVETVTYPVKQADMDRFHIVVNFENTVEKKESAREISMTDLWCQKLGVFPESRQALYTLDPEAVAQAAAWFPKAENEARRKRVAIQLLATARLRTYPLPLMRNVVDRLLKTGHEVFILGEHGSAPLPLEHPQFFNVTADDRVKTFAQSAAILATCDGFIGPDSALTHLAGALNIPAIALYGPFPAHLRVNHAPSIRPVIGHAPCAPCFHHVRAGQPFPPGQPCNRSGWCLALENITPARVVHQLQDWMELRAVRAKREEENLSAQETDFDRSLQKDADAGRLDALGEAALAEHRAGKTVGFPVE